MCHNDYGIYNTGLLCLKSTYSLKNDQWSLFIDTGSSEYATNIQRTTNGNVMQQFYSVIQYNAITLSVLLKEYSYKLQFMSIQKFQV